MCEKRWKIRYVLATMGLAGFEKEFEHCIKYYT